MKGERSGTVNAHPGPGLGAVLSVHRSRPGLAAIALFVAVALLVPVAVIVSPGGSVAIDLLVGSLWVLLVGSVFLVLSSESLAVCERGLSVGSSAPFVGRYEIRYGEISTGSLVPVEGALRYGASTGVLRAPHSIRIAPWVRRGIHFVGPSVSSARRGRAILSRVNRLEARSFDGRWIWFAGTGRTPPEQVTAQIAQAAGQIGFHELAHATASAPLRTLSGVRRDRSRLLPGYPS